MVELARFVAGAGLLALGPGWLATHALRRVLAPTERGLVATVVGLLASGALHYRWNTWIEGIAGAPGGGALLWVVCGAATVAAIALTLRERARGARGEDASPGARLAPWALALALLPLPVTWIVAAPNGRVTAEHVERTQDEPLHQALIGEFLRPGPVQVPWLAGHPMSPYEFLAPATEAAFVRTVGVDPVLLVDRFLPLSFAALAGALSFLLVRRFSGSSLAGALGSASLAWGLDVGTPALFVTQLHAAEAYLACATGVLLLQVGLADEGGAAARRTALALAALVLGCIFQLKTTLFATLALTMLLFAGWRFLRARRLDVFVTGVGMAAVMVLLGTDYLGAALGSPLAFGPGVGYAHQLAELPPPFAALGRSPLLGLGVGLPLMLLVAFNLKLVGLPWALGAWRAGARPSPAGRFLMIAVAVGAVLMASIHPPAHPGSLVPFWFAHQPMLLAGQTIFGIGAAAWILRASGRRRWLRGALLATPGVLAVAALPGLLGDDPQLVPIDEARCGRWLFEHSAPTDVVLVSEWSLGVPLYSLRPVAYVHVPIFEGDKANEIAPAEFLDRVLATARERRAMVSEVFASRDVERVRELAREAGADLLYLGPRDALAVDPQVAFGAPVGRCGDGGRVFEIPR